jgi:hypothetical protein
VPDVDLSEFKQLGKRAQRKPCSVAESVALVPAAKRSRVLAALESGDEEIRRGVKRWMENRDVPVPSSAAMTYHRARRCACHA